MNSPVIQYPGGKWKIAPWIISHFPTHHDIYVEPFGGAASVLLQKKRSHGEVYNDLDGEIVNLFRVLQDNYEVLVRKVELTPFARDEYKLSLQPCSDPTERARRLLIRSWMGYGAKGTFGNSSFNPNMNKPYNEARRWLSCVDVLHGVKQRFRGVVIENREALEVIQQQDSPKTLFYVDPPYLHTTRNNNHLYNHELSHDDHIALLEALNEIKGMAVVSGYVNDLYSHYLTSWGVKLLDVHATNAQQRTEALYINPAALKSGIQLPLFEDVDS